MNRWLLTVAGMAAAGSAIAANTNPAAPKAEAPRQTAAVKATPARRASTPAALPMATRPASTPTAVAAAAPIEPSSATTPALAPAAAPQAAETAPAKPDTAPAPEPKVVEERDVVIKRVPGTEVDVDEDVDVEVVDPKSGKKLYRQRFTDGGPGLFAYGLGGRTPEALQKNISVDINDARPKDALEAVIKEAGGNINLVFDKDAPNDARITLKVKQVSAMTLVGLITQNAGLDWNVNVNQNGDKQTTELRISKGGSKPRISSTGVRDFNPGLLPSTPLAQVYSGLGGDIVTTRKMVIGEQRLTLECPNCKVKSTIIRQRSQPRCPKCSRTFQNDWQFCPADGTKRPADPNEWKFCPACGKKIEVEKASIEEGGIPFLSDLPVIGELFRKHGNGFSPYAFPKGPDGQPFVVPAPGVPGFPGFNGFPGQPGATPVFPRPFSVPGAPSAAPALPKVPVTPVPAVPVRRSAAPDFPKGPVTPVPAPPVRPVEPPQSASPSAPAAPVPTVPAPEPVVPDAPPAK